MYENGNFTSLNIEDVLPNRFQPRIHFDEGKLNELAESIRKYGVIQPIIVRQIGDKYEIIAGERRYKASKIANKNTIPAIIINLNDKESEEIALLENVQRQNLTPIEEAVSYKRILDMGYITQTELAEKLGKTQSTIANKIRLLNLDDQVQYALLNGQISERHARSLLRIHDKNKQIEILNKIINERLTVKKTDEAVRLLLEQLNSEKGVEDNMVTTVETMKTPTKTETVKVNNKPFVKSEPVEDLFAPNEPIKKSNRAVARGSHEIIRVSLPKELEEKLMRKEEKTMDIDKIMREAQDINVPEQNKDISGLMKQDATTVSSFETTNTVPITPVVETPSVSVENNIPLVNDEQNKFVNFNGISKPEEPTTVEPVQQNNDISFDSIFNQTPVDLQPVNVEPMQVTTDVPVSPIEIPTIDSPVENNSSLSSPSQPTFNQPVKDDTSLNNNAVSIAEAVQKAMNSNIPLENAQMGEVNSNNELPPISSSVSDTNSTVQQNNTVQPTLYNELMDAGEQNLNSFKRMDNTLPPLKQEDMPSQVNQNISSIVPPMQPENTSVMSSNNPIDFGNQTITNIPDSEILENPVSNTMNNNMASNNMTVSNNNFIEVVRLIRNLADEIEKLGYKIDVDEIDLGNIYQANFKINKGN